MSMWLLVLGLNFELRVLLELMWVRLLWVVGVEVLLGCSCVKLLLIRIELLDCFVSVKIV